MLKLTLLFSSLLPSLPTTPQADEEAKQDKSFGAQRAFPGLGGGGLYKLRIQLLPIARNRRFHQINP
jgi:hypothetical protein